ASPGVHGDSGRDSGVQRSCRAPLRDAHDEIGVVQQFRADTGSLLAEQQDGVLGQVCGFDRYGPVHVVDRHDSQALCAHTSQKCGNVIMLFDVEIPIGGHRPTPVPAAWSDDVYAGSTETIGVTNNGADVAV